MKRFLSLFLIFTLLVSLGACTQEPSAKTTDAAETDPPAPDAQELFAEAAKGLKASDAITVSIDATEEHTVWGDTFTQSTDSEIIYEGLQGDLLSKVKSTVRFNDQIYFDITELFVDGHTYATFDNTKHQEESTAEEYMARQYPVCLFDSANFAEGNVEETSYGTLLTFTEATALETWVAPEYAKLISAEATALIGEDGMEEMSYTASFEQGAATVKITVEAELMLDCIPVLKAEAPADAEKYTLISDVEIPRMMERAYFNLYASKSRSAQYMQIVASQAGGIVLYGTTDVDEYNDSDDYLALVDSSITIYSSDGEESYQLQESYRDKTYTYSVDGEVLSEQALGVDVMQKYVNNEFTDYILTGSFITTAEMTDFGEGLLIEFTSEDETCGEYLKKLTMYELFRDSTTLEDMATAYETKEIKGYFGIDKDTWLPTSYSVEFTGEHTIEEGQYLLSQQLYASITPSNPETYENITEEKLPESKPEETATPVFYHVTGEDGSEMWLLGTIHVGDERTAYLPQEIYDAFNASDALAVEFNMNAYTEEMDTNEEYQDSIMEMYFYSDGTEAKDHLDADVYEAALKMMKYSGNYNPNIEMLKISIWENILSNAMRTTGRRLFSDKGVDQRLLDLAEAADKEILDVESAQSQVEMLTSFSDELQEYLLLSTMDDTRSEYNRGVWELYELWCSGDEAALIDYINGDEEEEETEIPEEERALYEEYQKAMSTDRDIDMVEVAKGYLASGKIVFYAVGLAHLLSEDGLVNSLRAAGYKVELVKFAS